MADEPILDARDRAVWNGWMASARLHATTAAHRHRVDVAKARVREAFEKVPQWAVMVSGGKDSSALAHVVASVVPGVQLASEKDDMDYPGEREYVEGLARSLGCPLDLLVPEESPKAIIARVAAEVGPTGNWHGRAAELSQRCFYDLVERYSAGFDGVFLGLRQDESRGRRMNRVTRGHLYQKLPSAHHRNGQWIATPLCDWTDLDVYGYLATHGIELLPVYRCVGFLHARRPGAIRKSWWIPEGNAARHGGVAWLRRYYPSLYRQLCAWMPDAARIT